MKIFSSKGPGFRILFLLASVWPLLGTVAQDQGTPGLRVTFEEDSLTFDPRQKQLIQNKIGSSERHIRFLLPELPDAIHISVSQVDWDLGIVGGVSGRSDSHAPAGEVVVWISRTYPGGIEAAVEAGLNSTLYHEFHHLARGWTINGNRFGPGIHIAAVNEGLAVVFAETYTGSKQEGNQYPDSVRSWVEEILQLPVDADYQQWVSGYHPDGRSFIGYRAGNYIIRDAMQRSGKGILELSKYSPKTILRLAGFSTEYD